MKPTLPLALLLGFFPAAARPTTPTTACFLGFASLSPNSDDFLVLVGKTYRQLLDTDPLLTAEAVRKLQEANDPFALSDILPDGSVALKKRLNEFKQMLDTLKAPPAPVREAIRAELAKLLANSAEVSRRQLEAAKTTENVAARRAWVDLNVPVKVSPDGRWVFQKSNLAYSLPGFDLTKSYIRVVDTHAPLERSYIEVPNVDEFALPQLSPSGKELLFINTKTKVFHRVPFLNGKVDWTKATQHGPFPVFVGPDNTWVPGAEPHLSIVSLLEHPTPKPFQFNWNTNTVTEVKSDPPFYPVPGTGYFSDAGREGYFSIRRSGVEGPGPIWEDHVQVFKVDKTGNAVRVGEVVKGLQSTLYKGSVVLEKNGDGFVVAPSTLTTAPEFAVTFSGFKGKPTERVVYPELSLLRRGYRMISHPTENGALVLMTEDAFKREEKQNRAFWLDFDTRKLSPVDIDHTLLTDQFIHFDVQFTANGKELAIQNGIEMFFVNFFTRIRQ